MKGSKRNLYQLDGRVPLLRAIPFGLQHILAMFVANITPIIILSNAAGLDKETSAMLLQNCMIIAGIGTLIQLYPVWRIGARLPIVMGISFTFLSVAIAIVARHGMGSLIGAVIVGGIIEGCFGLFHKYWIKYVPKVVSATVVTAIGLTLVPIGANDFAGGAGAADFGSARNWILGSVSLIVCVILHAKAKGTLRALSILAGLAAGYILALCIGAVDFSPVHNVKLISMPRILPFKPEFHISDILAMLSIFFVSATETIGDSSALCYSALKREITDKELGGSISCDGFISSVAGMLGCTPITTFSQNIGLIAISRIVNRFTIAVGATLMILGGLFPVFGIVLNTIPNAVLGGCTILMFGSILYAGFEMISKSGFTKRNLIITGIPLCIGFGFTRIPAIFNIFPEVFRMVFAENCVAIVFILAVFLNLIVPEDEQDK